MTSDSVLITVGQEYEEDEAYKDDEELHEKLQQYKSKSSIRSAILSSFVYNTNYV